MTIKEHQDNVIEELSFFDDWMDKYDLLIDMGNSLTPLYEKNKTERSLLYRQGRIKRAFIPYSFQRVGSDGEANASVRNGLPGKGTTIKIGVFTRI